MNAYLITAEIQKVNQDGSANPEFKHQVAIQCKKKIEAARMFNASMKDDSYLAIILNIEEFHEVYTVEEMEWITGNELFMYTDCLKIFAGGSFDDL